MQRAAKFTEIGDWGRGLRDQVCHLVAQWACAVLGAPGSAVAGITAGHLSRPRTDTPRLIAGYAGAGSPLLMISKESHAGARTPGAREHARLPRSRRRSLRSP